MTVPPVIIRVLNPGLDEFNDTIILRGVISPDSLAYLKADDYQREVAPLTSRSSILNALEADESLPDIELGMRGQRYTEGKDGTIILLDPVYIVDGLQRVSTAIHYLGTKPDAPVRIGAMVHFDTTKEWERERFRTLNTLRAKVSPNVLLRNRREDSRAMLMLYGLTTNTRDFVMCNRVSWNQRMTRGELITALTFVKCVGYLHSHKTAGKSNSIDVLVPSLDKTVEVVGLQNVRKNAKAFFDLVDECWGIRRVQYREGAAYMRGQFLFVLARLLADHTDFWRQPDEEELFVEASLKRKLAQFPVYDPQVVTLAGSSGKAREMLYMLLRDHINRGKTTKRLKSRNADIVDFSDEDSFEKAA